MAPPSAETGVGLSHARFSSICRDVDGIRVKPCKDAIFLARQDVGVADWGKAYPYVTKHIALARRATFQGTLLCF
jgi:hypothetical protein